MSGPQFTRRPFTELAGLGQCWSLIASCSRR